MNQPDLRCRACPQQFVNDVRGQHDPTCAPGAAASAWIVRDLEQTAGRVHDSYGNEFKGGMSWVKHRPFKRVKYHLLSQGAANTARRG